MERQAAGRSAFTERVKSIQEALTSEYEQELQRREEAQQLLISALEQELSKLRAELAATQDVRCLLQRAEDRAEALAGENHGLRRQLDLSRRQIQEAFRGNSILKKRCVSMKEQLRSREQPILYQYTPSARASAEPVYQATPDDTSALLQAVVTDSPPLQTLRPNSAPASVSGDVDSRIVEQMSKVIRSSQSTEDEYGLCEEASHADIKEENDGHDDAYPTVTAIQTVRKRGRVSDEDPSTPTEHMPPRRTDGTARKPFVVKEEPSSSPTALFRSTQARPPESLDLDEIAEYVTTPHKRRRLQRQVPARPQNPDVPPAPVPKVKAEPHSPATVTHAARPRSADDRVLQPVSANAQNMPRKRISAQGVGQRPDLQGHQLQELAEDGESFAEDARSAAAASAQKHSRPPARRLQGLLESPPAAKRPPSKQQMTADVAPYFRSTTRPSRPAAAPTTPAPLRARSPSRLTLSDFKLNPAQNGGAAHAFAETARTAAEKRCLPGCTDARCCGAAFRQLARWGLGATPPPARALLARTPSPARDALPDGVPSAADMALLEAHVGGGRAARQAVAGMAPGARRAALLDAKAAALAAAYGKHRVRHARRASPDGFWDVEFPSTQKADAERAAARASAGAQVAARHREALKGRAGGGLFLFRDE